MEFLVGLSLVGVALVIWLVRGSRPQVLRTFEDGRRVLGPPPMHTPPMTPADAVAVRRLAHDPAPDARVAAIRPGHHLQVTSEGRHWIIADAGGRVAHVGRPGAAEDEPGDALTTATSNLPAHGTLWVDRVLQDAEGSTIDLRGVVHPEHLADESFDG